eukprot:1214467-Amphidinium_carterae.1
MNSKPHTMGGFSASDKETRKKCCNALQTGFESRFPVPYRLQKQLIYQNHPIYSRVPILATFGVDVASSSRGVGLEKRRLEIPEEEDEDIRPEDLPALAYLEPPRPLQYGKMLQDVSQLRNKDQAVALCQAEMSHTWELSVIWRTHIALTHVELFCQQTFSSRNAVLSQRMARWPTKPA